MPVSFRLALIGFVGPLVGAGVFVYTEFAVTGWDVLAWALASMAIFGAGLLLTLAGAIVCLVRHPAWRKSSASLIGLAIAGLVLLAYVWANA